RELGRRRFAKWVAAGELGPRQVDRWRPAPRLRLLVEHDGVVRPDVALPVDGVAEIGELRGTDAAARGHAVPVPYQLRDRVEAVGAEVAVGVGEATPGIGGARLQTRGLDLVPLERQVPGQYLLDQLDELRVVEEVLLGEIRHLTRRQPAWTARPSSRGANARAAPGGRTSRAVRSTPRTAAAGTP